MTLLVDAPELARRRLIAQNELEPLLASLGHDMEWMLGREPYIPSEKALLSRASGRCPRDGTLLEFDPKSPHAHRCAQCGETLTGELHDRFWIYWYQLWLAERAVHGALIGQLADAPLFTALAVDILDLYAAKYLDYPNEDNVLGPSRLFFSTYLESVWLLQICVATSLLEQAGPSDLGRRVRERIVEPGRKIIAEFDEALSNRQVWNNAALFASARLLGDASTLDRVVHGPSGLLAHLERGLLADGTWYEGENYHLFAHRGLWYGVMMAERAGIELPASLRGRFHDGFSTPFVTALPDFTLLSRRDSPYGVSLRQWRIAEHVELGLRLGADDRLVGALFHMYHDEVPRLDTGRSRSSADIERHGPATALSRADLSWRALLHALPDLPVLKPHEPTSVLLEQQGLAVFRRRQRFAALDFGASGGGHGHPDRLNLLLVNGATRWLDDFGTGSYVDRSLHWYRSTLAHNAPLVDGRSQQRTDGVLHAYDTQSKAGWIVARAEIAPGVNAQRTIVVLDEYVLDELTWEADRQVTLDLPLHAPLKPVDPVNAPSEAPLPGSTAAEDGFGFLQSTACSRIPARSSLRMQAAGSNGQRLATWTWSDTAMELWRAEAPGAPIGFGTGELQPFVILRLRDMRGSVRTVWSLDGAVNDAQFGDEIRVMLSARERHVHRPVASGWEIAIHGDSSEVVSLGGLACAPQRASTAKSVPAGAPVTLRRGLATEFALGERSYVKSEVDWNGAGKPAATVALLPTGSDLSVEVRVPKSERTFVPVNVDNPLDNEAADINGDGVQLYMEVGRPPRRGAWVLVPEPSSERVRVRDVEGASELAAPTARWSKQGDGYAMTITVPSVPRDEFRLDVMVNEKPAHRARRRGQLVLSGGRDGFVYLRGDRQDWDRLLTFRINE